MKPYQILANAIVEQAADDYRAAFMALEAQALKTPKGKIARLERFFRSEWFTALTMIEGEQLMKDIKINELSKAIKAYEMALDPDSKTYFKMRVVPSAQRKKQKKAKTTLYDIAPRFAVHLYVALEQGLKDARAELAELLKREE